MKTVNLHAAKTQLSRLVDEAAAGEEIVIAKAGRPMVRLVTGRTGQTAADSAPTAASSRSTDFDDPLPPEC